MCQCTLCQYSLGGIDGAAVHAHQHPGVCHAGANSVGWLGLVWTRDSGLTKAVGQLGCPDPVPIHSITGEGDLKP